MTKFLIAMIAFVGLSQAQAQTAPMNQTDEAVVIQTSPQVQSTKRTLIYDERTGELVEVQPQVQAAPASTPIVILNNQKLQGYQGSNQGATVAPSQVQVQEQPTTVISESPLKPSTADEARRARKDQEAKTEDSIVEALERARLEDETRRREKINGVIGGAAVVETQVAPVVAPSQEQNQTATISNSPNSAIIQGQGQQQPVIVTTPVVVPVQEAPAQVAAPIAAPTPGPTVITPVVPVIVEEREERRDREDRTEVRSEIRASLDEVKPEPKKLYYVSGLVGMGKYADVVNVEGNMSAGVAVGAEVSNRIIVEGSFVYGQYDLQDMFLTNGYYPRIVDMRQYNLGVAAKYEILTGKLRPNVAAIATYTRRSYSEAQLSDFKTSNAFDVGIGAGLDFYVNPSFAIGLDVRYFTNVALQQDTNYPSYYQNLRARNDIESLDYYTTALTAKFAF